MLQIVEERGDNLPKISQWEELKKLIDTECSQKTIPAEQSQAACFKLLEYQHPKPKETLELRGGITTRLVVTPLSDEEVETFKRHFNEEY